MIKGGSRGEGPGDDLREGPGGDLRIKDPGGRVQGVI